MRKGKNLTAASNEEFCACIAGTAVPEALAKQLEGKPLVKQWMLDHLGTRDVQSGAPPVTWQHKNPLDITCRDFHSIFNNRSCMPDAHVLVAGKQIWVHRAIIARVSPVLANSWNPQFNTAADTSDTVRAATLQCSCTECGIGDLPYSTGLMFLEFMYSGELKWPSTPVDSMDAAELLVLADYYDVPYLVAQAQIALCFCVSTETCCDLLRLASHHHAPHLENCCIQYIVGAHSASADIGNLDQLSMMLKDKLRLAGWAG